MDDAHSTGCTCGKCLSISPEGQAMIDAGYARVAHLGIKPEDMVDLTLNQQITLLAEKLGVDRSAMRLRIADQIEQGLFGFPDFDAATHAEIVSFLRSSD